MDYKIELVPLPVTDVDRARDFYRDKCGFHLDHDTAGAGDFRVLQFTPPGSACSIGFGVGVVDTPPGSVKGLILVVADIHAARAEFAGRGVEVSEVFELGAPGKSSVKFASFSDPDGNTWNLQQPPG